MIVDMEAKEVEEGDFILVPIRVQKITKRADGKLVFELNSIWTNVEFFPTQTAVVDTTPRGR